MRALLLPLQLPLPLQVQVLVPVVPGVLVLLWRVRVRSGVQQQHVPAWVRGQQPLRRTPRRRQGAPHAPL